MGKSIAEAQRAAGVPDHLVKTLTPTMVTRWGNQEKQLQTNNTLRLAIDPAVDKFKREHKGDKEAIVDTSRRSPRSRSATTPSFAARAPPPPRRATATRTTSCELQPPRGGIAICASSQWDKRARTERQWDESARSGGVWAN